MEPTDYINPAIIGIILALLTNIFYFEYRFNKEKKSDFIKKQIDELLLPLFIEMKSIENKMQFNEDFRGYLDGMDIGEFYNTIAEEDKNIWNIAKTKLNLATPTLSKLLLDFNNYQYRNDEGSFKHVEPGIVGKNFEKLQHEVFNEYEQKVKEYQNMKPWWHFWEF